MVTYTITISRRTLIGAIGLMAALLGAVIVVSSPQPADAASTSAEIQVKGIGTNYAKSASATRAVVAGGTTTFYVKVVNRGASYAQFKLRTATHGYPGTYKLLSGTQDVTFLASSSDGWITPQLAPAGEIVLKLKSTSPVNQAANEFAGVFVNLYSTANVLISGINTVVVRTPGQSGTAWDLFTRAGSDGFVGGSVSSSISGPSLKPGQSTVFTARLENNGTTPGTIGLRVSQPECAAFFPIVVKDGTKDVTAAVKAGTYATPSLTVGSHRDLKITVSRVGNNPACPNHFIYVDSRRGANGVIAVSAALVIYPGVT